MPRAPYHRLHCVLPDANLTTQKHEISLQTEALEAPAFHMRWGMSADSCPVQRGPSGGFAGHGDVGYGVSYHIKDENMYLHVCYRRSEEERGPGSKAFSLAVEQALLDMSILCTKTAQVRCYALSLYVSYCVSTSCSFFSSLYFSLFSFSFSFSFFSPCPSPSPSP